MTTKLIKAPTDPTADLEAKLGTLAEAVQLLMRARDLEQSDEYKELVIIFGEFSSTTYIGSNE